VAEVTGRYWFPDGESMGLCGLDDPQVQTVAVLVNVGDYPANFHLNEDRLGYVDPQMGERRFAGALEAARLFAAAPDLAAAARRVIEGASAPDRGDGYTGLEGRPSGTRVSVDLDDLLALAKVLPREVTNV